MCLGKEDAADLRPPLRQSESDEAVETAIREAISRKPKGHDFIIDRRHNRPAVARHMSVTGGLPPRPPPPGKRPDKPGDIAPMTSRGAKRGGVGPPPGRTPPPGIPGPRPPHRTGRPP